MQSLRNRLLSQAEQEPLLANKPESLLERYKPFLRLDRNEPYPPMAIERYISRAELYVDNEKILNDGEVTPEILNAIIEDQEKFFRDRKIAKGRLRLKPTVDPLSDKDAQSFYASSDWRGSAKIYGKVFDECIKEKDGTILEVFALQYVFTYGFDDPTSCLPFFKKGRTPGWHFGDIERITVYIQKDDHPTDPSLKKGDILKVYFAQHGSGEGECVAGNKIEYATNDKTHVVVSVARGTHASYPAPGRWWRIMGCFNDLIQPADVNPLWEPPSVGADEPLFSTTNLNYGYDSVTAEKGYWGKTTQGEVGAKYYSAGICARCCCGACTCCPDSVFDAAKAMCMSFDHEVLSSTHIPTEAAPPRQQMR